MEVPALQKRICVASRRIFLLAAIVMMSLAGAPSMAVAQTAIGGHIGFVLPPGYPRRRADHESGGRFFHRLSGGHYDQRKRPDGVRHGIGFIGAQQTTGSCTHRSSRSCWGAGARVWGWRTRRFRRQFRAIRIHSTAKQKLADQERGWLLQSVLRGGRPSSAFQSAGGWAL